MGVVLSLPEGAQPRTVVSVERDCMLWVCSFVQPRDLASLLLTCTATRAVLTTKEGTQVLARSCKGLPRARSALWCYYPVLVGRYHAPRARSLACLGIVAAFAPFISANDDGGTIILTALQALSPAMCAMVLPLPPSPLPRWVRDAAAVPVQMTTFSSGNSSNEHLCLVLIYVCKDYRICDMPWTRALVACLAGLKAVAPVDAKNFRRYLHERASEVARCVGMDDAALRALRGAAESKFQRHNGNLFPGQAFRLKLAVAKKAARDQEARVSIYVYAPPPFRGISL